jgi:hypothetical protein
MNIGDLVRHIRTGRIMVVWQICPLGNIGLWSHLNLRGSGPLYPGSLIWTHPGALEHV